MPNKVRQAVNFYKLTLKCPLATVATIAATQQSKAAQLAAGLKRFLPVPKLLQTVAKSIGVGCCKL